MQTKNTVYGVGFMMVLMILGGVASAQGVEAAASCSFKRDLQMGVVGDDVKCLQQYLNKNGFPIAKTGVGSAGQETGEYKVLTEAAVIAWQKKNNLIPASGFFGNKSRVKFAELQSGIVSLAPTATTSKGGTAVSTLQDKVDAINKVLAEQKGGAPLVNQTVVTPVSPSTTNDSAGVKGVHVVMKKTLDAIKTADNTISDNADSPDIKKANKSIARAYKDFFVAMRAYLDGDYEATKESLATSMSNAKAAAEYAGKGSEESDAQDAIDDADATINDVSDAIDAADEDGTTISQSVKLLRTAKNALSDAETAFDDEDYAAALEAAEDAKDVAEKAESAIGEKASTGSSIASVRKSLASAQAKVKTEQKNGTDIGNAKRFLSDAAAALNDADDADESGNDSKIAVYVTKAQKLIKSALNEF